MPSLTVAMIVGNELVDGLLDCSLRQSQRVADEIVVVDTSADGSGDYCASLGCRVETAPPWMHYGWWRNKSLAMATGDWILVVDADELIDDAFVDGWPELLTGPEAYALPTWNFVRPTGGPLGVHRAHGWYPDPHFRLFRNDPAIYYSGELHEQPCGWSGEHGDLTAHIYHYGWARDEAFLQGKIARRNAEERRLGQAGEHDLWGGPWSDCQPFEGRHPACFDPRCLEPRGN